MNGHHALRRVVVCIDGVTDATNASEHRNRNPSTIKRVKSAVAVGRQSDGSGRLVEQIVKYHQAAPQISSFAGITSSKSVTASEQQVRDITEEILQCVESPSDEIFIFGSGCAAHIIRAVTSILHHMGVPRPGYIQAFPDLFDNAIQLIKARQEDDSRNGEKALAFLRARTEGSPNIKFVGFFDALKSSAEKVYDISTIGSIRHFRHAMAFNENRGGNVLYQPDVPPAKDMQGRSFIQAWFLGHHTDMVGGTQHDGLSLYPLQWMLIEATFQGLRLSYEDDEQKQPVSENPLALAFPQYAGKSPDLSGNEKIQWRIRYSNNVIVNMFDLQSLHVAKLDAGDPSHTIHFENNSSFYNKPRNVFQKELIGYDKNQPNCTIIHPSVFCILDRNERFYEQASFRVYREQLADFEVNCLINDNNETAPWLQDSELLASGVKAFRILVCGKTGVGKSTLINKVFGVEMTEESNNYSQGQHDINQAFESPNHPGLLIHDSRGWQAGSDHELDLIAQFLRLRAFQKDPAEALHVIWFCVDSDVSRIEEADKRTFETIAQFSNHVPVFVVGTKKDKLIAMRKMQLLEEYMEKTNDYKESNRLANIEADKMAEEQFLKLRDQLSQIKAYKADGYVCLSKNDELGVKSLLTQTLEMIVDERVRLFCVAAQVVDVEQKMDSAITECMRLGKHAIRTAMVPLPLSGVIGTPTVSRIICEHVLQCFGFPKTRPNEVDDIMSRIVLGNLKQYMAVSMSQFLVTSGVSIGVAVATMGAGVLLGVAASLFASQPTARMVLKCACDMILILERAFRYNGKYVSTKQIEDSAKQYVTINTTTFGGKEIRLQQHVHDEIDKLIPLAKINIGFRFAKLRTGLEAVIYKNRFDRPPDYEERDPFAAKMAEIDGSSLTLPAELSPNNERRAELPGMSAVAELDSTPQSQIPPVPELPGTEVSQANIPVRTVTSTHSQPSEIGTSSTFSPVSSPASAVRTLSTPLTELSASSSVKYNQVQKSNSEGSKFFSKIGKSLRMKKSKTAF